jgi:type IV secretory pathway TraG/TraD family ATPase VirD4
VKALFLASKWVAEQERRPEIGDLMTAAAIAALPNLSARMKFASLRLNIWNSKAFSQIVGVGGGKTETNVTEGGIIANANKVFQKFVEREFVSAICGTSDFNPDIEGKTLVVIGLNQDYRAILSPILATAIDTIVSRNVAHSRHRQTPLVVSLDEVPSIYLPKLANWLAEARSAGFVGMLGLQNFSQFKDAYGEDKATTILGNCATKHFLNPQDVSSAEQYSKYLGEQEIVYWTKSINGASGAGSKASISRSEQRQKVPLMTPEEFLKLPQGRAVTISPGYTNKQRQEGYIPIRHDISVATADIDDSKRSVAQWDKILANMQSRRSSLTDKEASQIMEERRDIVERLFPEPPPGNAKTTNINSLVNFAIQKLGAVVVNSISDRDIPLYPQWFVGDTDTINFEKLAAEGQLLITLLESYGVKFN